MNCGIKGIIMAIVALEISTPVAAEESADQTAEVDAVTSATQTKRRLTLGGYGEAVMTRNFYSDNIYRYSRPYEHKDDDSHGRFDLPHVVINLGYDFGKGWTMGTEIEFEHGGTESAVEMDADLEQFWINYKFLLSVSMVLV